MTYLHIEFNNALLLKFKLCNTSIAKRWANELNKAQTLGYSIDDPRRFYGFNSFEDEEKLALELINNDISIINSHKNIISRCLVTVHDQDTLNYLHHIFEVYHGLLDTQHENNFFASAPQRVKQALADLNIHVHRCESVARGANPRCVVTYYGLPKTQHYDVVDYLHFTNCYRFGTVYANYVEIGKTLGDLARDNDSYISEDAFRPYVRFSADFNIKFFDTDNNAVLQEHQAISNYYNKHSNWFKQIGYDINDYRLSVGQCPVAEIVTTLSNANILSQVRQNQYVTKVWIE